MDGYDGDAISDQEWDSADQERLDEVFKPAETNYKQGSMKLELDLSSLSPTTRRNVLDAIESSLSKDWRDITRDLKGFWADVEDDNESKQQMLGWQKAVRELRDRVEDSRKSERTRHGH